LRKLLPRRATTRTLILAFPVLALLVVFAGTGAAGAETAPTGKTDTIYIREGKGFSLKFVGPKTVTQGDTLKIVNATDPKRVGPHTFSLVTEGSLPKTPSARQKCFTPKHICLAIAKWQGAKGEEPPTINPSKAGEPGWDTEGNATTKKGDSWFTAKKGQSFEQIVSADTTTGPKTLHFICAVHAWMQGQVKVVPPAA
jgi:hypothetical protein